MMKSVLILDEFFAMTAKIRTLFLSHIKITNYLTLKHGTFKLRRFLLFHKTSFAHVPNRQGAPHGGNTSVDGSFCYRPSIQLPCIRAGADRQSFVSEILHGSKRRVRGCFGYYRPLSTTIDHTPYISLAHFSRLVVDGDGRFIDVQYGWFHYLVHLTAIQRVKQIYGIVHPTVDGRGGKVHSQIFVHLCLPVLWEMMGILVDKHFQNDASSEQWRFNEIWGRWDEYAYSCKGLFQDIQDFWSLIHLTEVHATS